MGVRDDVISALNHLSKFFDDFIWHKKKGKIVGPARVSGRASWAFLNRFRVWSREGDGGTEGVGGEGVSLGEGSCHVEKRVTRVEKKEIFNVVK